MLLLAFFVTKLMGSLRNANEPSVKIIQNELKDRFDDLAKSQGYVSNEEYEALKGLAKRLEERVSKLEELLEESRTK
jgi:polyhydroxyalkanoate synthesis regulator phasin